MTSLLTVSPSPHVRSGMTTQKIMLLVVLALVPAIVAATVAFGPRALFLVVFCAVISMFTEMVCQKLMQKETTYTDGSAMLTGVLLALNLPATLPLWEAAIGCVFAIAVVKQLFGGLGCNSANPAITGRVFLLLSFGGDMTTWVKPFFYRGRSFFEMFAATGNLPDGVTGATPLASGDAGLLDLFLGNVGGSLGETSALALLIGGVFLLVLGLISWHTPVAYLGGLAVLELFYTLATGGEMTDVLYALLSGGVILGAFFMATDYVTTPMTGAGKLIFGLGCALLTFVIREFANMVTRDKIAAAEADAIQTSLKQLPDAGTFEEVTDFQPENNEKASATGLYLDENGQYAVLVTADGYNKGGLQVVIGVDKGGAVTGVSFVTVSETPGLGTKVQSNPELLVDHLVGLSDSDAVDGVDNITGATYSSKGMKAAVNCALATVHANQEVTGA